MDKQKIYTHKGKDFIHEGFYFISCAKYPKMNGNNGELCILDDNMKIHVFNYYDRVNLLSE